MVTAEMLTQDASPTTSADPVPSPSGRLAAGAAIACAAGWLIWSCAEHWIGNPNYSYGWMVPVLAVTFALRRAMTFEGAAVMGEERRGRGVPIAVVAVTGAALVFALEFAREQVWHQQIVLYAISLATLGLILAICASLGGVAFARWQLFPALFLLTAVPWPPRIEQPLTSGLMQAVAAVTVEILHWIGIQAISSGGAIALRDGVVGVTEACSGIRSLQSGLMFGLAMGEWFLLSVPRRIGLLAFAIGFALISNLGRTLTLALQADRHGVASVESIHDLVGNIAVTALIVAICLAGKLLARRRAPLDPAELVPKLRSLSGRLSTRARRFATASAGAILLGLVAARVCSAMLDANDHAQTDPSFTARSAGGGDVRSLPVPREIWNELRPSSGEYVRVENRALPSGAADGFHFFWKPSPWNRFALVHRPDICMPGVGWESAGEPQQVEIDFAGRPVRFYAFRFRRGNVHALELWGVWRNGEPVAIDYTAEQALGAAPAPPSLQFAGRRRSATEIVACSLITDGAAPPLESGVAAMQSLFAYSPP